MPTNRQGWLEFGIVILLTAAMCAAVYLTTTN